VQIYQVTSSSHKMAKDLRLMHINPNGDLPTWVINQSLGRISNMLKCIKASVEKL
jgi:hypothetical protein